MTFIVSKYTNRTSSKHVCYHSAYMSQHRSVFSVHALWGETTEVVNCGLEQNVNPGNKNIYNNMFTSIVHNQSVDDYDKVAACTSDILI